MIGLRRSAQRLLPYNRATFPTTLTGHHLKTLSAENGVAEVVGQIRGSRGCPKS
jgi:hypothetical protein